jgi:hypothetical protein
MAGLIPDEARQMKKTVAAIFFGSLLAACGGQPVGDHSSVTQAEIGNVVSMSKRADGNFDVQCDAGFGRLPGDKEVDTPSQVLANQICLRRQWSATGTFTINHSFRQCSAVVECYCTGNDGGGLVTVSLVVSGNVATLHFPRASTIIADGMCDVFPDLYGACPYDDNVTVTVPLTEDGAGWSGSTVANHLNVKLSVSSSGAQLDLSVHKSTGECGYNTTLYTLADGTGGTLTF